MGPLSLGGNGHEDEQEPKLKIKKYIFSFTCDAFFVKKRSKLIFLTWHWGSTLSTLRCAWGELRAQTVWFPPCRTDGWVPSWSCVFQPRPPGCVGPPAAGSSPTPLSGTGSQSEKYKNKHAPTVRVLCVNLCEALAPWMMTVLPGYHNSCRARSSTLPTLYSGQKKRGCRPQSPKASSQTKCTS